MVTITRHIFIIIFQTEYFLVVKFSSVCEKNMSFHDSYDTKISKIKKQNKTKQKKLNELDQAPLCHFEQWHFKCSLGWGFMFIFDEILHWTHKF